MSKYTVRPMDLSIGKWHINLEKSQWKWNGWNLKNDPIEKENHAKSFLLYVWVQISKKNGMYQTCGFSSDWRWRVCPPGLGGTKKWLGQEGAMPQSIRQLETWWFFSGLRRFRFATFTWAPKIRQFIPFLFTWFYTSKRWLFGNF